MEDEDVNNDYEDKLVINIITIITQSNTVETVDTVSRESI